VEAIHYSIAMGARVINASWGASFSSRLLEDAVRATGEANVLFVAAAGNSRRNSDYSPMYPAGYRFENVISVAASTPSDTLASFSNYGASSVHIAAPGAAILSSVPRGTCSLCDSSGYRALNGTSMAAPHVAGVAAMLMGYDTYSATDAKSVLLQRADTVASLQGKTKHGRLNAHNVFPTGLMLPDLILERFSATSPVASRGSVTYDVTFRNGASSAIPNLVLTGFYVSNDRTITWEDRFIGYHLVWSMDPLQRVNGSGTFTLPADVTPGDYYLGAWVDASNCVIEQNENDNTLVMPFKVVP
jgi:subtilisin family serine protease